MHKSTDKNSNDNISYRCVSRTAATSKMELFVIIVNGYKPFTIITNCSILNVGCSISIYNNHVILTISWHIQNPGIFNIWGILKTFTNIYDNEAYWEPCQSQNSLFRHFQAYSGTISSHFQGHWRTLRQIEAYLDIIETQWAMLSHIHNSV